MAVVVAAILTHSRLLSSTQSWQKFRVFQVTIDACCCWATRTRSSTCSRSVIQRSPTEYFGSLTKLLTECQSRIVAAFRYRGRIPFRRFYKLGVDGDFKLQAQGPRSFGDGCSQKHCYRGSQSCTDSSQLRECWRGRKSS